LEFEELIQHALDDLPAEFRARLDTVAIVIDEQATPLSRESRAARGAKGAPSSG